MEPQFWWPHYESARAIAGCAARFRRHRPLIENLEDIFSYLLDTLLTLCNYKYGAHLFLNRSLGEGHYVAFGHHRSTERKYKRAKLEPPEWDSVRALLKHQGEMFSFRGGPAMSDGNVETLNELARCYGTSVDHPSPCLIIPFDYGEWDLGIFVLWGTRNPEHQPRISTDEQLRGWIASYYRYIGELLAREFIITKATYLPSFCATGWSRAAILFSDIRDFTPLTEMIRNRQAAPKGPHPGLLQSILSDYCTAMAKIIQAQERGRIDKFLGDGIMAIFGEHEEDPSKSVCRAINVACQMVTEFDKLKPEIMKKVFHDEYEFEYNETVEPRLGIGINFGTVLFDYVGDERHREYTAIGDHVNFAQRLEAEAARTNPQTNKLRPSILLSTTAYLCAKHWLTSAERLSLTPKGKGRGYTVYGIEPSMFDRKLYTASELLNDWETRRDEN